MILDRPLKEVHTGALCALHRGIEKRPGLSNVYFHCDDVVGEGCRTCALGSLGESFLEAAIECAKYGLLPSGSIAYDGATYSGLAVEHLSDKFKGTNEERREFMLRHIVNELRERGKSIDGKAAEKELSQVSI